MAMRELQVATGFLTMLDDDLANAAGCVASSPCGLHRCLAGAQRPKVA